MKKRALISVSDKKGLALFGQKLASLGYEIISTGGTARFLAAQGIDCIAVSDITHFPECLDGRVKTLHPNIHGGILAVRDDETHLQQLRDQHIQPIDMVVVNLYPFKETILKENVSLAEAIENIDIGGPTMIRAAAKNCKYVTVITDPADYEKVLQEIEESQKVSQETNFYLATKVFEHTAQYDALIASYFQQQQPTEMPFPQNLTLTFEKVEDIRYGENPHQKAAFYKEIQKAKNTLPNIQQLHGKELSFNNLNDTSGALALLREFDVPTIVACKHANPCGVGSGETILEAYQKAYAADPVSIFGGIVVANRTIDEATAIEMNKTFLEIVLAPSFTEEALTVLKSKKNVRLLTLEGLNQPEEKSTWDIKKVSGGILVQTADTLLLPEDKFQVVTHQQPTEEALADLLFAWKIVKHTKSNGIVIAKQKQSIGIGVGQVSRIWATKQAIDHGLEFSKNQSIAGAVLASDAFFPFADCVEAAHRAGIAAIIQPGGSIRDQEVIDLCNQYHIPMLFTKMRHFKH